MTNHTARANNPAGEVRGPGGGPRAKSFMGGLKRLMKHLGQYKGRLIWIAVLAVCSTLFSIIGPKILSFATDELASGAMGVITGSGAIDFAFIGQILLLLLGLYLVSAAFSALMGFIMAGLSSTVSYRLRGELSAKINRLPLSYFHKNSRGDVLSRITNDVDAISQALNQSLTQLITAVVTIIGVVAMMLTIRWQLALVSILIAPVSLGLISGIARKSQKYFQGQQKHLGSVNGHVEEMYAGHVVIKAFNGEEASLRRFDQENDKLYHSAWKSDFLSGLMQPLTGFIGNLGYVAVCVIGVTMTAAGTMTIGGIQAFIQYVRSFTQPIGQAANISGQLQQLAAASERVFEFLEEQEEERPAPLMTTARASIKGDVLFDHVRFGYEGTGDIVINDFSADVRHGQKIAIVGPTGAGKTTMVKLLMRFHDLKDGAIYVDGYDITAFDRQDLRSAFGMVLQDTWLYSGSILDNIRYGRPDATDDEVIQAAKAARADHFIRTLPDGYHTELNEAASNLSQGQRQLLTIARALLSDPKILILDEATSSVDTRTEVQIQRAMDRLMEGRTSFVIAHRLSTIRNADLILCMKDGDIVQQGSHDELMKKGGFYANLYNSQFERNSVAAKQISA